MRKVLTALALAAGLVVSAVPASASASATASATATPADQCSAAYYDGDARLGPADLPTSGKVGFELIGYHRTGTQTPADFLAQYYDPAANGGRGGWIYPPQNGYLLTPGGSPIEWHQTLLPGQSIDRFGSEYGSFLAPEYLPYAMRAIPPQSLDSTPPEPCNYHDYRVLKPFQVDAGPIAAWFAQPGGGLQYQLDPALVPGAPTPINVLWLVNNGYLARI
ncbi:MAG: TNT domain-containing protein, partial [Catenulispora sp.]|nr:TNT domain-containing protein [Catenulispora sp.]